ncbi:MAG TPA: hypothetical protein VGS22_14485 [Thermoanaerobaculia bacterium]|nr:hypothetical protein [Thermoanaerobaculia bacterium]
MNGVSCWPLVLYFLSAAAFAAGALRLGCGMRRGDAAILILVPLVFVGPALATGRTLSPIDRAYRIEPFATHRELLGGRPPSAGIYYDPFAMILPWRVAVRHAFALGEWPLWNPFSRAGEPLAGLAQSAPYAPVNLLALLVPIEDEAAFTAGLSLAIAGLGGFLALAAMGLSRRAALVGAVAWSSSNFLLFWHLWPVTPTLAFFPLVLFAATRLAREPTRGHAALLALAFTLILLTGHSESVAHAVVVAAVWAAAVLPWRQVRTSLDGLRPIGRAAGLALGAGVIALALSAFFLLPQFEAIGQSRELVHRRGKEDRAFHARPLGEALASLRAEVVPFVWGVTNDEVGKNPTYGSALSFPGRAFSGGLILALAVAGLAGLRRATVSLARERLAAAEGARRSEEACRTATARRRLAATGGALYLFGVLAGVGFRPIHELLARLPLFDLSLNSRLSFVAAFGLALLAAAAIDAWDRDDRPNTPATPAIPAITAGAAAALAGVAYLFWPDASAAGSDGSTYLLRTAWLVVPALLGAALLTVARRRELIVVLLLAAHLAERRAETGFLFHPQERRAFFPQVAPLDAVPEVPETGEPQRVVALRSALPPDMATHYGFEDPRGDNALTLRRLARLRNALDPTDPKDLKRSSWTLLRFNRADDPALDLFNVRYVLVPHPKGVPPWYRPIAQSADLALYENRHALPRAFLPREVIESSDAAALLARTSTIESFGETATIEPIGRKVATTVQGNAQGRLATQRRGLGFRIDAELSAPGWIVVSETHWRGWRATIEGRELPLAFADHAFVGIRAPAGRSRIDLVYRPQSFLWGLRISTATALLLLLAGGFALARRRRPLAGFEVARPTPIVKYFG